MYFILYCRQMCAYIIYLPQWDGDLRDPAKGRLYLLSPFSNELPCRSVRSIRSWETR